MSAAKYISVGDRIELFTGLASLPYPASKTDDTAGADVSALITGRVQRGPALAAIYLEASADATWTNVRIHVFERGWWAALAVGGAGDVVFPTLTLKAGFPIKIQLDAIGDAERVAVTADTLGGANASGWIQRVEVDG